MDKSTGGEWLKEQYKNAILDCKCRLKSLAKDMEALCEMIQEGGKTDGGQRTLFKELHFVQNKENCDDLLQRDQRYELSWDRFPAYSEELHTGIQPKRIVSNPEDRLLLFLPSNKREYYLSLVLEMWSSHEEDRPDWVPVTGGTSYN